MKVFQKIKLNQIDEALENAINGMPELISSIITGRLYNEGTDSNEKPLRTDRARDLNNPYYSTFTMSVKQGKGQKTAPVTLNDTNDFYNSFDTDAKRIFLKIKADFKKNGNHIGDNFQDSYNSDRDFEKAILNLSEDDKRIFIKKILPNLIKQYKILVKASIP